MVKNGLTALAVALVVALGLIAPVAAQSCEEFANQKEAQQQLEQAGDVEGLLDPDGNGIACEGVFAAEAPVETTEMVDETTGEVTDETNVVTISQDAPDDVDAATGESGVTTQISTDDGDRGRAGGRRRGERRGRAGGDGRGRRGWRCGRHRRRGRRR